MSNAPTATELRARTQRDEYGPDVDQLLVDLAQIDRSYTKLAEKYVRLREFTRQFHDETCGCGGSCGFAQRLAEPAYLD